MNTLSASPQGRQEASASLHPGLYRFAQFSALLAFFVLFAGGMVTSTGSGLAVPDWPLSFGQINPPMVDGVFFEHGHRVIAGCVAALTCILAIWLHVVDDRRWIRRTALAAGFGVLLQAVLGGVTVLYGLPPQVSIAHACLGQALFCCLIAIAQGLSPTYRTAPETPGGVLYKDGVLAVAVLFCQLLLGASLRHTSWGLIPHILGAVVALWAVTRAMAGGLQSKSELGLGGLSTGVAGLILLQLFLGVGALFGRSARAIGHLALLPTIHQATGAIILGLTVLWTLRAYRRAA
jgi:cytochrome c oxidase assembly protein subunit 15